MTKTKLILYVALTIAWAGCSVESPQPAPVATEPAAAPAPAPAPTVVVAPVVVAQDDYVYYPGYEVYYSNHRHQYTYMEGHTWVSRPTPPRVTREVLIASPSVHVDFHDAPANHHTVIVKQYPTHWAPPHGHDENHH